MNEWKKGMESSKCRVVGTGGAMATPVFSKWPKVGVWLLYKLSNWKVWTYYLAPLFLGALLRPWNASEWMGHHVEGETIYIGKMPRRRSNLWMADFLLHIAAAKLRNGCLIASFWDYCRHTTRLSSAAAPYSLRVASDKMWGSFSRTSKQPIRPTHNTASPRGNGDSLRGGGTNLLA